MLPVPDGFGKISYTNGDQYAGGVRDGLPHGRGRHECATGDVYEGEFHRGLPAGSAGTFTGNRGLTLEGEQATAAALRVVPSGRQI
jgi:hypothetical protein